MLRNASGLRKKASFVQKRWHAYPSWSLQCRSISIACWLCILPCRDWPSPSGHLQATLTKLRTPATQRVSSLDWELFTVCSLPQSRKPPFILYNILFCKQSILTYRTGHSFPSEWATTRCGFCCRCGGGFVFTFNHVPPTMNYYSLFMLQQHLEVLTNCKACSNSSSQDKLLLPDVFNLYRQDKEGGEKESSPPPPPFKRWRIQAIWNSRTGPETNQRTLIL